MRLFFLFLLLTLCLSSGAGARAATGGRYMLEATGQEAEINLFVNDIPVEKIILKGQDQAGVSFNHWLKAGQNTLRIEARPLKSQAPLAVRVSIAFLQIGTSGISRVKMVDITDAKQLALGKVIKFNLANAPRLNLWQAAAVTAAPAAPAVQLLLATLRQQAVEALSSGQSFENVSILHLEREDEALAFGVNAANQPLAQTRGSAHTLTTMSRLPEPALLNITPVASAPTLFMVRRQDGLPLIQLGSAAHVNLLSVNCVLLGVQDGQWRIMRRCA